MKVLNDAKIYEYLDKIYNVGEIFYSNDLNNLIAMVTNNWYSNKITQYVGVDKTGQEYKLDIDLLSLHYSYGVDEYLNDEYFYTRSDLKHMYSIMFLIKDLYKNLYCIVGLDKSMELFTTLDKYVGVSNGVGNKYQEDSTKAEFIRVSLEWCNEIFSKRNTSLNYMLLRMLCEILSLLEIMYDYRLETMSARDIDITNQISADIVNLGYSLKDKLHMFLHIHDLLDSQLMYKFWYNRTLDYYSRLYQTTLVSLRIEKHNENRLSNLIVDIAPKLVIQSNNNKIVKPKHTISKDTYVTKVGTKLSKKAIRDEMSNMRKE